MYDNLYFRRQFLLSRAKIAELASWQCLEIAPYHLYVHPDLEITTVQTARQKLILLGYLFDPRKPQSNNIDILNHIKESTISFAEIINKLRFYPGRYALLYLCNNSFYIIHDALALREVYYCQTSNRVVCGSQPNILVKFAQPEITETNDPETLDFMRNHLPFVRNGRLWVGDETCYTGIKHLMPNHCLEINSMTTKRYSPNRELESLELDDAVRLASKYLQGVFKAITGRYDVMMAVTSGIDSRSLLAGSKEVMDRIYYFINKHAHLDMESPDIKIPKQIFDKINNPFHIHEFEKGVDDKFRNIFLNNTWMAKDLLLPAIYNVYFKNCQNKLNLLGVGEIGREYYGIPPKKLDGYYLAWCLKYRKSKYAANQCEKWLKETRNIAMQYHIDIMKLFLWECLLGNWGAVGNSESDIAIEEFDPYDSHYIYEVMLSLKSEKDDFFEGLFRAIWPSLLEFPFNPPQTMEDKIKEILKQIGAYQMLKQMKYRLNRWMYMKFTGTNIEIK